MSSTTKLNQFNEDYQFYNRSDESKHFMRKSKKFDSGKAPGCACQARESYDFSASDDEEDSKPCCGFPDNTKCKNFVVKPNKEYYGYRSNKNEENGDVKYFKRDKTESWTKSEEKAMKLKEKLRCKCHKNNYDGPKSKKNKSDKPVINVYTKLGPDGLPPSNKTPKDESKCKKSSKCKKNSNDVIKICRNSNVDQNDSTEEEEENGSESETSFYAGRSDNYRRFLGPTIDETVLVCLDLLTNIAMKINMFRSISSQSCGTKSSCRRKLVKTNKKELEAKYSFSDSSDS